MHGSAGRSADDVLQHAGSLPEGLQGFCISVEVPCSHCSPCLAHPLSHLPVADDGCTPCCFECSADQIELQHDVTHVT